MKVERPSGEIIVYNEEAYMNEGRNEEGLLVLRNQQNKSKVLAVDDETFRNMKMGHQNATNIMQSQKQLEEVELNKD